MRAFSIKSWQVFFSLLSERRKMPNLRAQFFFFPTSANGIFISRLIAILTFLRFYDDSPSLHCARPRYLPVFDRYGNVAARGSSCTFPWPPRNLPYHAYTFARGRHSWPYAVKYVSVAVLHVYKWNLIAVSFLDMCVSMIKNKNSYCETWCVDDNRPTLMKFSALFFTICTTISCLPPHTRLVWN